MSKVLWSLPAAALLWAVAAHAHHSISMIETSAPVWVTGAVARYEIVNPHTMIELDVAKADGQIERWVVEGPIVSRIERMGVDASLLAIGDVVEICGFYPKKAPIDRRPPTSSPFPPWIHGHVMLMPNGAMQPWGPYGKLDNCIRPSDDEARWLQLLDSSEVAHDLWCGSRNSPVPTIPEARALAAQIDEALAVPCARRSR